MLRAATSHQGIDELCTALLGCVLLLLQPLLGLVLNLQDHSCCELGV